MDYNYPNQDFCKGLEGEPLIAHPLGSEALTCEALRINIDERPVTRIRGLRGAIAASRSSCVPRL